MTWTADSTSITADSIIATADGYAGIDEPSLATITVSPATATVAAGGTQQFSASQLDQYGEPIETAPVMWAVDGDGTIDESGLYTAPSEPATDEISAAVGDVVGHATVTVSAGGGGEITPEIIQEIIDGVVAALLSSPTPVPVNVTHVNGRPATLASGVAQQATLEETLNAVNSIEVGGGVGTGPRAIKITAVSGGDGMPGVRFGIVGTKITGYSDSDGLLSLYVDGDDDDQRTYTLRTVAPAGYASVEDREVTVGSDDVPVVVELTLTALETAEAPKCNVLLPVEDQQRNRLPKTTVKFTFDELLPGAVNTGVIMNRQLREVSDANGEVQITLGRLCRYTATYSVGSESKSVTFDVPDEGSFIVLEPQDG